MSPDDAPTGARARGVHPPALAPAYRSTRLRAPTRAPFAFPATLSEMTGPVFGHGALGPLDDDLTRNHARDGHEALGPRIIVHGRVSDGERPVPGALIEIWQANAAGRYRHHRDGYAAPLDPDFGGCGRVITDAEGRYRFRTIQPAPYPWPNGGNDWRPAHIHLSVFGRAFVQRLVTQMYFEGDPLIRRCPILGAVPTREGVERLVAPFDEGETIPMDARAYRFDVVLRGRRATPFEP